MISAGEVCDVVSSRGIGVPFWLVIKILKCKKQNTKNKVNGDVLLVVRNLKSIP